jgi:hypothetical protein
MPESDDGLRFELLSRGALLGWLPWGPISNVCAVRLAAAASKKGKMTHPSFLGFFSNADKASPATPQNDLPSSASQMP